jgi:SIT4-associating protein SAP185/190
LITYLSKEDHIKSLLQWVVAGLDELDQEAEKSDTASLQHAISSPHLFPSFQLTPMSRAPAPGPGSPPLEPAKMADESDDNTEGGDKSPYSPDLPAALGQGLGNKDGDDESKRAR